MLSPSLPLLANAMFRVGWHEIFFVDKNWEKRTVRLVGIRVFSVSIITSSMPIVDTKDGEDTTTMGLRERRWQHGSHRNLWAQEWWHRNRAGWFQPGLAQPHFFTSRNHRECFRRFPVGVESVIPGLPGSCYTVASGAVWSGGAFRMGRSRSRSPRRGESRSN